MFWIYRPGYPKGTRWVRTDVIQKARQGTSNSNPKYPRVAIPYGRFRVHILILEVFKGSCPPNCMCRHLDDNPLNNKISNLAWGTHQENSLDKVRNGKSGKGVPQLHARGEKHSQHVITEKQAIRIKRLRKAGLYPLEIAK